MSVSIQQVVILAGGRGTRFRPLTDKIPKPMAPVKGKPFLDYLIYSLVLVGIKKFLILLGYKGEVIQDRYSDMKEILVEFSHGITEDRTGRRVLNAYDLLDDHFLLVYGDNYWPVEWNSMMEFYNNTSARVSTTVFSNKNGTGEYGAENNVQVSGNGLVSKYDKKREAQDTNGVDIGYFIVGKDALDQDMQGNVSFEIDILPQFIARNELAAYVTDMQYHYITTIDTLRDFESVLIEKKFSPLPEKYFGEI